MTRFLLTENAGRGRSAGPRTDKRVLDRDEVLERQAYWRGQAAGPERKRALTTIRNQLASIANRVENRS